MTTTEFQSTLLQEERPVTSSQLSKNKAISIHAPTRGATIEVGTQRRFQLISIHAPTRGATSNQKSILHGKMISIHAPTRGATASAIGISAAAADFNPRSYKRSDGVSITKFTRRHQFQSTLLQEERRQM